uniref:RING-type domain-containing protein n=1 Tax=Chromera velia CCMP2878 TaxID=1169474 RepID=A0A0G4HMV2_9ALVE|eukprot:Cvel_29219.t1-p1 / transcript=Cvel_29219.t1 / gene=Cvel_29219 / organism=Chromera_velia_CCMP2878 / gene_product=hypothetical protein / transcript_product=hypothetical protein / location=Cvel_scaffold3959:9822-11937(+) / protein_length=509 / sequence_SO=supercontig / SO=protein_coding / is_pseudo=false
MTVGAPTFAFAPQAGAARGGRASFGYAPLPPTAMGPAAGAGPPPVGGLGMAYAYAGGGGGGVSDALTANVARIEQGRAVEADRTQSVSVSLDRSTYVTVLGLSVQESLAPAAQGQCFEGLKPRAQQLSDLSAQPEALFAALMDDKPFTSDVCVFCLENDPPLDAVLLPCGHQCMHFEETDRIDTCPVCRKAVMARLCVSERGGVRVVVRQPDRAPVPIMSRPLDFENRMAFAQVAFKPVVYLYPPEEADVSVSVRLPLSQCARFTSLVPRPWKEERGERGRGCMCTWNVRARPDGLLFPQSNPGSPSLSRNFPPVGSLFWEALYEDRMQPSQSASTPVFCVETENLGDWLLRALGSLGLTAREYTEMATFWASRFAPLSLSREGGGGGREERGVLGNDGRSHQNQQTVSHDSPTHVLVRFLDIEEIVASVSELIISPPPSVVVRVYALMAAARGCPRWATRVDGTTLSPVPNDWVHGGTEREGEGRFVAVEWGGSEVTPEALRFAADGA